MTGSPLIIASVRVVAAVAGRGISAVFYRPACSIGSHRFLIGVFRARRDITSNLTIPNSHFWMINAGFFRYVLTPQRFDVHGREKCEEEREFLHFYVSTGLVLSKWLYFSQDLHIIWRAYARAE